MSKLAEAAERRAAGMAAPADRPRERRHSEHATVRGTVRALLDIRSIKTMERNGLSVVRVGGYASTTEDPYEMFDFWGPYTEEVGAGAFTETLAASPLTEFTCNHGAGGGLPMAHTRSGTLDLAEDDTGLRYDAYVDPSRTDVADMLKAMERGDLAEASFKFRITSGQWSPDWETYRIKGADLNRGDVSTVNFGANPNASSGLRSVPDAVAAASRGRDLARLTLALADI
jgi:HK97 family phage prohead protease